ncbi:MAG: ABC transporter ATP-binding protein [Tenericutes bacterium]|nr:ABC transporter ATP-binding protein [Mycoplasmatota bacterium]
MGLEIRGISKFYGKKKVLSNVSIDIEEGKSIGLLGPNGAGKTTLIRCCIGLSKQFSGQIVYNNIDIKKDFISYITNISVIYDRSHFYEMISGKCNLEMISRLKCKSIEEVNDVLQYVGLKNRKADKVKKYSLGMKKRLQIAASLIGKPELIFLDEPFSGLDYTSTNAFVKLYQSIKEDNVSLVVSTHNIDVLHKLVDKIYVIFNGEIIGCVLEEEINDEVIIINTSDNSYVNEYKLKELGIVILKKTDKQLKLRLHNFKLKSMLYNVINADVNNMKTIKYIEYYYSELIGGFSSEQIL